MESCLSSSQRKTEELLAAKSQADERATKLETELASEKRAREEANANAKRMAETTEGRRAELERENRGLSETVRKQTAELEDGAKYKSKTEQEIRGWKEKQDKLVELLHQMERDRDKKSAGSKKETQLGQQCQSLTESVETLTNKFEEMKADYEGKLVSSG